MDKQTSELRGIASMVVLAVLVAGAPGRLGDCLPFFPRAANERLRTLSQVGYFASLGLPAVLVVLFLWRLTHPRRR